MSGETVSTFAASAAAEAAQPETTAETAGTSEAAVTAGTTETAATDTGTEKAKTFAAEAVAAAGSDKPKEEAESTVDLAGITDDDYAKAVQPDVDGEGAEQPDRSLVTAMAKELREAGIQPSLMKKIVPIYNKVVDAEIMRQNKEQNEKFAARMRELDEACQKEITPEQRKDFICAYNTYIANDPSLSRVFNETELGSTPGLIKLIALAGATIRVDETPSATATVGNSQTDINLSVFRKTVPDHLRC